jgi:hypothetical protein
LRVKIKTLLKSIGALGSLGSLRLAGPKKLRIARIIKQVNSELETFNDVRKGVYESHGGEYDKPKDKFNFKTPEGETLADAEVDKIVEEEVDIIFDKFSLKDFESLEISAMDVLSLEWLLTESLDVQKDESKKVESQPEEHENE